MSLTDEQIRLRTGKLTASRVGILMNGDDQKIYNLWREMIGDPDYVPENLDHNWSVQLGSFTEPFHLDWIEWQMEYPVTRRGEVVIDPIYDWAACTLDGWMNGAPVEVKHVGGFEPAETILARYQPQLHWQMMCTVTKRAYFSVINGAREPVGQWIMFDEPYATELLARAVQFMGCVENMTPPVTLPSVSAPVQPEQYRTVDFTGNNQFAVLAAGWLNYRDHAKKFATAEKGIKELIEKDVGTATGYGIIVKRSKSGAITIKEQKE